MKSITVKSIMIGSIMTLLAAFGLPALLAHGGPGHGGVGAGTIYFDPDTIQTISGTLVDNFGNWEQWGHGNHTGGGMGFTLQADSGEEFELMLAPFWFLEENGVFLEEGDRVTVTGSVVEGYIEGGHHHQGGRFGRGEDNDYIVATVLNAGGIELELRDERGYPIWSGGGFGHAVPWFDPDTITTVKGAFTDNLGMWSAWGFGNHTGNGMHLVFKSEDGTEYYTMLGPWWYLEENGIEIEEGLEAKITGSVVQSYWEGYDDRDYLIATKITVKGKTVELRDENGVPLWGGTGWHYFSPDYDTKNTDDVTGAVRRIRIRSNGDGLDPGYEVILRNEDGKYRVFVSPEWYADMIGLNLKKGDEITVRGSIEQRKAKKWNVVATDIFTEERRYRLRKNDGTPRWVTGAR